MSDYTKTAVDSAESWKSMIRSSGLQSSLPCVRRSKDYTGSLTDRSLALTGNILRGSGSIQKGT